MDTRKVVAVRKFESRDCNKYEECHTRQRFSDGYIYINRQWVVAQSENTTYFWYINENHEFTESMGDNSIPDSKLTREQRKDLIANAKIGFTPTWYPEPF